MSLFSLIRSWLQPRASATPAKKPTPQPKPRPRQAPVAKPQPDPNPEAAPLPPATGAVDSRVHVRVYYQNASDHTNLRAPLELVGHPGEPLPIVWAVFPGFVLTNIVGFTQVFPASNQVLLCAYSVRVAGPVMVYHRDRDGRLLQVPQMLTGGVNQPYTAKALPEFAERVVGPATQRGIFTPASQRLRFTYSLTALEVGQRPEDAYIQLQKAKLVYRAPLAGKPLRGRLPANTFWRVYALMRDTNTKTVWLNVGGSQWITANDTRSQAENPFLPDPTPLSLPHALFVNTQTPTQLRGRAIADTTLWAAPFGEILPRRLAEGTPVAIVAVANLDNDSRWYQLADGSYVLAVFVTVAAKVATRPAIWGGVTRR